ncbi:MAG TPA: hypothetical protein VEW45_08225 [Candidatus Dormibacteraeota bacterium]|nr:hypothetical protein [Candidatus Dormibacteraeota bacterium]
MTDVLPAQTASIMAAAGFLAIAVFQVALALGAPLGRAAWGGAHERLPANLRIGSAVAVVIWLLAALIVLARGGSPVVPLPVTLAEWGTWAVFGLSLVGAIVNFASSSPWERFGWGPLALFLTLLCLIVALG